MMPSCNFRTAHCMVVCAHKQNFIVMLLHAHTFTTMITQNANEHCTCMEYPYSSTALTASFSLILHVVHDIWCEWWIVHVERWNELGVCVCVCVSFTFKAVGWMVYTLCALVCFILVHGRCDLYVCAHAIRLSNAYHTLCGTMIVRSFFYVHCRTHAHTHTRMWQTEPSS